MYNSALSSPGLALCLAQPQAPGVLEKTESGSLPPTLRCSSSREDDKAPGSATLELGAYLSPYLCDRGLQPGSRL